MFGRYTHGPVENHLSMDHTLDRSYTRRTHCHWSGQWAVSGSCQPEQTPHLLVDWGGWNREIHNCTECRRVLCKEELACSRFFLLKRRWRAKPSKTRI